MKLNTLYKLSNDLEYSKEVIERLVELNIKNKLDSYLKTYEKREDAEGEIKITIEKNGTGLFFGKVKAVFDGELFLAERDDYENMDDLINNLFDHIKEQLSKKK